MNASKKDKRLTTAGKKQHTIKAQLVVDFDTLEILSVVCRKGRLHDLRILKESWVAICPSTEKLSDSGYQRIRKLYPNSDIPQKRQNRKSLSVIAKRRNTELSKRRIRIEHVNRRCKIFGITKEAYRGKHKNFGRSWHVVCALVNARYLSTGLAMDLVSGQ